MGAGKRPLRVIARVREGIRFILGEFASRWLGMGRHVRRVPVWLPVAAA